MHIYQCCNCETKFSPPQDYEASPASRRSPCCNTNPVMYIGYHGALPAVIGDYLPGGNSGMLNHADGQLYDSKSAYLRSVKEAGCEVMGNDVPLKNTTDNQPTDVRRDVIEAYQRHN